MITTQKILKDITSFREAHDISKNKFGLIAVHDHKLVKRLEKNARITTSTIDKIYNFMTSYDQSKKVEINIKPNDFFDLNPEAITGNHTTITQQNHVKPGGKHAGK